MAEERVLVICQHYWPESFRINDICDFLVEQNTKVDVLCGIPNYPKGAFFSGYSYFRNRKQQHKGVSIRRAFEIPRGKNTTLRIFLNYISFPLASLFHIPRLLTKHYDKIFIYQLSPVMMSIAGIIVGKLTRTETTMYVLDLWPENLFSVLHVKQPFLRRLATSISHWHYRHADKLVVLSEKMKDRLVAITQITADRIIVIPQACEKVYESSVRDEELEKKFEGGFNIVYAGNISPAQSFETMIKAATNLKNDGFSDIRWIIVGDGMSRKSVEAKVDEAGLAGSFYFEGHHPIDDIPKYTHLADVLVGCLVKSDLLEATIPAKVMSYIASGKPMVLAMDGEVQELVNNQIQCGYAGPAGDAETLTENIRRMYAAPSSTRSAMGTRARDYHFTYFERSILLQRLRDFIFS